MAMSDRATPTRVVSGLAPFVERALDDRSAREALGPSLSSPDEPGGSDARAAWSAAHHAGQRVTGQRIPRED